MWRLPSTFDVWENCGLLEPTSLSSTRTENLGPYEFVVDSPPPVQKDWFEIFLCKIPIQKDTIGLATLFINWGGRVKGNLVWNGSFLLTLVGGNSRGYGVALEWRKESKRKCLWHHAKEVSLFMLYVWGISWTFAQGVDFSYHVQTIVSVRRGVIWGSSVNSIHKWEVLLFSSAKGEPKI